MPLAAAIDSPTIITVSDRSDASHWLAGLACQHVELGVNGLGRRNVWAARLDEIVQTTHGRIILVAESVSCFAVAWWARLSPDAYVRNVAGALLLDPLGGGTGPTLNLKHFSAPSTPLPFPALVCTAATSAEAGAGAATLATSWGSRFVHAAALDTILRGADEGSAAERELAVLLAAILRTDLPATVAIAPTIATDRREHAF